MAVIEVCRWQLQTCHHASHVDATCRRDSETHVHIVCIMFPNHKILKNLKPLFVGKGILKHKVTTGVPKRHHGAFHRAIVATANLCHPKLRCSAWSCCGFTEWLELETHPQTSLLLCRSGLFFDAFYEPKNFTDAWKHTALGFEGPGRWRFCGISSRTNPGECCGSTFSGGSMAIVFHLAEGCGFTASSCGCEWQLRHQMKMEGRIFHGSSGHFWSSVFCVVL